MFIGHFGAALAAKKIDSRPSIGTYFMASQLIDLLWPLFVLLGIERVEIDPGNTAFTPLNFIYYPFTHSLAAVAFWAIVFGTAYYLIKKNLKGAVVLAVLVLSHWFLDFLTHRPDLPIFPGWDYKVGLGLWNSILFSVLVEGIIFIAGAYLYFIATKSKNKSGTYGLWALLIFFVVIYFMNLFGPPPPNEEAIGYAGLFMWVFVAWGYWIDKNRMQK